MHERDILKIKAIRSKDIYDWAAEIKLSKKAYYMEAFHENESNVKKTWGIINELASRKQNDSHIKEIKLNGSLVSDPRGYRRRLTRILQALDLNLYRKYLAMKITAHI